MRNRKELNRLIENISSAIRKVINEDVYNERNDNVKNWYTQKYPKDNMGRGLNPVLTFSMLWKYMKAGVNAYVLFAVEDSIIRERIFEELSRRLHTDYDEVYNTWLKQQLKMNKEDYIIDTL